MFKHLLVLAITTIFVENVVLVRFLGICPFLGVSKNTGTAVGMGMAVTFVITISSVMTWLVSNYVLDPLGLEYLRTLSFILIIAGLVQLVEMFTQKSIPSLYNALGIYLPLITTNCVVLGVALLNVQNDHTFEEALVYGISSGLSFTLAIFLFAGVREKLEASDVPQFLKGFPIALITAGLIAIAFLGFAGLQL
ncbi:MAG: electron transport complex subunit RsxA [Eubacteriales bacterium]|jgi:electron transport complex protein RnfA|nr:electron transport complex subunit RsxA [Eubacteriales bacterium]